MVAAIGVMGALALWAPKPLWPRASVPVAPKLAPLADAPAASKAAAAAFTEPVAASESKQAASGASVTELLRQMHRIERAHCTEMCRREQMRALQQALQAAVPSSGPAAVWTASMQESADLLKAKAYEAGQRMRALRLAQLDARHDDLSRGIALWLRGQADALPALALRSNDPRLLRLALRLGCKVDVEACRRRLRDRWLQLEPDNAAAWLVQWERFSKEDPSLSPGERERQMDALLAGMAQATRHDRGIAEPMQAVLTASGPAPGGLHATVEMLEWHYLPDAAPRTPELLWFEHCRPPSSPTGSVRARACVAAAHAIWNAEPVLLLDALSAFAVVRQLGEHNKPPWDLRERRLDALRIMLMRQSKSTAEFMVRGTACQPDPVLQDFHRQWLMEGDVPALLAEIRRQGLDESELAAEHRARMAQSNAAASAASR